MTTSAHARRDRMLNREHLHVPAVCDVLDDLGHRHQAMHQRLRPLDPENCTFVGRARTFRWMETDYVVEDDPYGLEIDAMDSLQAGRRRRPLHRSGMDQRPLGRADEHASPSARRRRLHLRQPDPRLPPDHGDGLPGLLRGHPPARQQGPGPGDGL